MISYNALVNDFCVMWLWWINLMNVLIQIQFIMLTIYMWTFMHLLNLIWYERFVFDSAVVLVLGHLLLLINHTCRPPNTTRCAVRKPVKKCPYSSSCYTVKTPLWSRHFLEVTHTAPRPPRAPPTAPLLRRRLTLQPTSIVYDDLCCEQICFAFNYF